jgi:predicted transcriptional regulator
MRDVGETRKHWQGPHDGDKRSRWISIVLDLLGREEHHKSERSQPAGPIARTLPASVATLAAAEPPHDLAAVAAGGILWSMRVKTSVTIDERVLRAIDRATSRNRSRSRVIEDAAREFIARRARAAREARDLEILNDAADALNREMDDVLTYQVDV